MAPRRSTASGSQATPSTAAKGKDRKPARLPSSDAEEESDGGRLPKFEHVQMQYLNQPVDGKQSDTKLRALLAELKLLKKELGTTLEVLGEAASDVAESSAKKAEEVEEMEDEVPEDEVSRRVCVCWCGVSRGLRGRRSCKESWRGDPGGRAGQ